MIKKLSVLFVALAFITVAIAQDKQYPNVKISGDELGTSTTSSGLNMSGQKIHFPPVQNMLFTWTVNPITTLASGYDLQSNGSTQQLWYDLTNGYLHAVYCTSQQTVAWSDRTTTYFFSDDQGANWSELGNVPPPAPTGARSGFPSIIGLTNGAAVITNHNNGGDGFTTSKLFIDSGPAEFNFTQYNPGKAPQNQGEPIWGKMTLTNDNNVVLNSSISTDSYPQGDSAYVNVFNTTSNTFSGWNIYNGDQAETYAVATSPSGKIGHAYIGGVGADGYAWYRESTDGGLTYSTPVIVYNPGPGDTIMGTIRGVDITFAGESPCVVYEIVQQVKSTSTYFPGLPSEIHFWNPDINGGNEFVLADSNNVPYNPYNGINDVQTHICRPVIGKAQGLDNVLFVAFDGTTEWYSTTVDTTSFCAGFFMMSQNSGATWTTPEQFTPEGSPLLDFRFPSIAPVAPVTGNVATVHISMQGDPTPGSQVNGAPAGITAQFYHFTTDVQLQSVTEIPVTFSVNMGVQAFEGDFPAGANVVVRGSFQSAFGDPGGNWQGNFFQLSDTDGDTIYTGTFNAPIALAGNNYAFKYVIVNPPAGDDWESSSDRPFTVTSPYTNLPTAWFNNDSIYTNVINVTNTLEFTADITSLLGSFGNPFDPTQDSLLVEGLNWDRFGKNVTGNRRLVNNNPLTPGIYQTTLTVTSGSHAPNGVGDSTKWKFKAYPDARFNNGGWETTPDRWHVYVANGSTVTLPVIVPNISPIVDVKEIGDLTPTAYDLGQNYPNPFNPTTSIRFSLPEAGLVSLKVFNLLGQEVATLVNSEKSAGVYETTFDASSVSSGIYFYTLKTENYTSTKRMVLLK